MNEHLESWPKLTPIRKYPQQRDNHFFVLVGVDPDEVEKDEYDEIQVRTHARVKYD